MALESSIDRPADELVQLIRSKYLSTDAQSKPMDFARKIQYFTLDVISDVGFGEPFGHLQADQYVNENVKAGEISLTATTLGLVFGLPWFLQLPLVARLLGPSENDVVGFGQMIRNARSIVETRLQRETSQRSDMLASFVRHGLNAEEPSSRSLRARIRRPPRSEGSCYIFSRATAPTPSFRPRLTPPPGEIIRESFLIARGQEATIPPGRYQGGLAHTSSYY